MYSHFTPPDFHLTAETSQACHVCFGSLAVVQVDISSMTAFGCIADVSFWFVAAYLAVFSHITQGQGWPSTKVQYTIACMPDIFRRVSNRNDTIWSGRVLVQTVVFYPLFRRMYSFTYMKEPVRSSFSHSARHGWPHLLRFNQRSTSAFPESGRSNVSKIASTNGCFRPQAACHCWCLIDVARS